MHYRLYTLFSRCPLAALGLVAVTWLAGSVSAAETLPLNGAGATFPEALYTKWFAEFKKSHEGVNFNYQAVGSGSGIKQATDGAVDFGATDGPMSDEQMAAYKDKNGAAVLHLPMALGAVVPIYNIEGVTAELNFTPEILAGIFLGDITEWNDKAIADANPGVKLPTEEIVVVYRRDGSGTTYCLTDYLSKVSASWKEKAGKGTKVKFPTGRGAKGNEGMAGLVNATPYSIGYTELTFAMENNLTFGKVKNAAGKFIKADLASTTAAAAAAAKDMPADFRVSITNASGESAYPIATFTWLMVPMKIANADKRKALLEFLRWSLDAGQTFNEALHFARLPREVIDLELKAIDRIQ